MSRSSKSIWKLPYLNPIFFNKSILKKDSINTVIRNSYISEILEGKNLNLYNGKKFDTILVKQEMVLMKLGEFSFTKELGLNKGKKKDKKK